LHASHCLQYALGDISQPTLEYQFAELWVHSQSHVHSSIVFNLPDQDVELEFFLLLISHALSHSA